MKSFLTILVFFLTLVDVIPTQASIPNSNPLNEQQKPQKIIVYGSDSCHYCLDTKDYLKKYNVPFVYYDVDQNTPKLNEMITKLLKNQIALDNVSLPVIDSNGKITMNNGDFDTFLKTLTEKR